MELRFKIILDQYSTVFLQLILQTVQNIWAVEECLLCLDVAGRWNECLKRGEMPLLPHASQSASPLCYH